MEPFSFSKHLLHILATVGLAFCVYADNPHVRSPRPNIVLLLADDMGYGDLGCYGNTKVRTPNIDSLAKDGLLFTRMYSQPVCSPARAALLTGRYPIRTGFLGDSMAQLGLKWPVFRSHAQPGGLSCEGDACLHTLLKSEGYATAIVGKWHLGVGANGEYLPTRNGFDLFYGTPGSHCAGCAGEDEFKLTDHELFVRAVSEQVPTICAIVVVLLTGLHMGYFSEKIMVISLALVCCWLGLFRGFLFLLHDNPLSCILMKGEDIIEQPYKDENMTLRMTDEALTFMSGAVDSEVPFFLFMSYLQPHVPSFRSPRFFNKSDGGIYYDSVAEIDWSVGVIMKRLEDLGMKDNTIVIFASDNGPELTNPIIGVPNADTMLGSTSYSSRVTLRGEKGSVWDGGIRVPAIFHWRGHIPSESKSDAISSLMDILPTVKDILNTPVSNSGNSVDGKSLTPVFQSPKSSKHHDVLLHFCDMNGVAAVSYGEYKVHYTTGPNNYSCTGIMLQPPLMFNVVKDPGETTPLPVQKYETLLNEIHEKVIKFQTDILSVTQSSHFSRLPRPWLFLCANFPLCSASIPKEKSYDHLFS